MQQGKVGLWRCKRRSVVSSASISLSRPRMEFIVPHSCRKTRGRKLSSDQTPGLLLASVDLPQMHWYLAKRNQGDSVKVLQRIFLIGILANKILKVQITTAECV